MRKGGEGKEGQNNGKGNGQSNRTGNGNGKGNGNCNGNGQQGNKKKKQAPLTINPLKAAVIVGLLSDALSVNSLLVDRAQEVQIVLTGSLRRKTPLDKMLDEIGDQSFDDVLQALLRRV
ncbi:hypothetical protein GTO91_16405 [Heliobacterium undosum]|uniref:Uncharacterized protein n=1 Tax=Heliomicrobium undosum TaxID=121734 RepID=A0A845L9I7_9FIRM|nr:hypothetical protein [Heliomicrobium undosum]MZP31290.1 hypothetical protein [Heliomicrobium undosum]